MIAEDRYFVRRYCAMKPRFGSRVVFKHANVAAPIHDNRSFIDYVQDSYGEKAFKSAVVVDKVNYNPVTRSEVLESLRKHLTGNVMRLGWAHFLQTQGKRLNF